LRMKVSAPSFGARVCTKRNCTRRQAALDGLTNNGVKGTQGQAAARFRVRELEREVQRKDKALAETAAILMLQKKVRGLWEVADGGTDPESDK
jgi:hypothetical protein